MLICTYNLPHVYTFCVAHLQLLGSLLWYNCNCYWEAPLEESNFGFGSAMFSQLCGCLFSLILWRVAGSWSQGLWGGMDLSQHFNFTFWSVSCTVGCFSTLHLVCITTLASICYYESYACNQLECKWAEWSN